MDMRNLEAEKNEDNESEMSMAVLKRKRLRKIVLVVLSQKKPQDWEDALDLNRSNPHLVPIWVKGTPTNMLDLERYYLGI